MRRRENETNEIGICRQYFCDSLFLHVSTRGVGSALPNFKKRTKSKDYLSGSEILLFIGGQSGVIN
jgi:hypothetical protein